MLVDAAPELSTGAKRFRVVWLKGVLGWGLASAAVWYLAMDVAGLFPDDVESTLGPTLLFPMAGYVAGRMMWADHRQRLDRMAGASPMSAPASGSATSQLRFQEIAPTWRLATRVWWGLSWRGMVAMVVSGLLGALFGAALAALLGADGDFSEVSRFLAQAIGAVLGGAASIVPVRLVLGHDFGDFRLALLVPRAPDDSRPPAAPSLPNPAANHEEDSPPAPSVNEAPTA